MSYYYKLSKASTTTFNLVVTPIIVFFASIFFEVTNLFIILCYLKKNRMEQDLLKLGRGIHKW